MRFALNPTPCLLVCVFLSWCPRVFCDNAIIGSGSGTKAAVDNAQTSWSCRLSISGPARRRLECHEDAGLRLYLLDEGRKSWNYCLFYWSVGRKFNLPQVLFSMPKFQKYYYMYLINIIIKLSVSFVVPNWTSEALELFLTGNNYFERVRLASYSISPFSRMLQTK